MKRLFILWVCITVFLGFSATCFAEDAKIQPVEKNKAGVCPTTNMTEDCMDCHKLIQKDDKVVFGLKEVPRNSEYDFPIKGMNIINGEGYFEVGSIHSVQAANIEEALQYFWNHGIMTVELELFSPGGGVFSAWKIISRMQEYQKDGMIIKTTTRGFGASAAFHIFVSGTKGYRTISPTCEMMWHEIATYKMGMFRDTPSKLEDQSEVYRHLQDTLNNWIATRGNITKEELDEKIDKDELWLNGRQMVEAGLADKFLWDYDTSPTSK